MQEQMGTVSTEMENVSTNRKEMLEIWNTVVDVETTSHGHISGQDMAKAGLSELKETSEETSQTETHREKTMKKKQTEHPMTVVQLQKVKPLCNWNIKRRKKRENKTKEIFQIKMTNIFPKLKIDNKPQIQETQRPPNSINTRLPNF